MPEEPDGGIGISESDARWLRSKAVPQPVETVSQPGTVRKRAAIDRPSTYVLCTQNGMTDEVLDVVRGMMCGRGGPLHELDTGHWPMVSMPSAVVDLLGESV